MLAAPASPHLTASTLRSADEPLLENVPESVTAAQFGSGAVLTVHAEKASARLVANMGELVCRRFTACHRYEPYWMKAMAGTEAGGAPPETQFLLAERADGGYTLLAPLLSGRFRCCLQGAGGRSLQVVAESGDPSIVTSAVEALYIAAGPNPYALLDTGAQDVARRLGTGRLRRDKSVPDFVDRFGWCTWNAFYQDVSHDLIRRGLESFRAGGILPGTLIVDDGWQQVRKTESGERRLTGFGANDQFPGGLSETVRIAKEEFGVRNFLVWHAMTGYWGGVDGAALPGYDVRPVARNFSPGILHYLPDFNTWWGGIVGLVSPREIYRFFQDYHRSLRTAGVDGVKVDTQATLEGVAAGLGGRVDLMRAYREALEGSAQVHFRGRLINCMSCASDALYSELASTVTRTSTDFWPDRPASHGLHLYVNSQVSLWFGQFIHPDWDMFQSGHSAGAFHAAARAIGGCPVYVSDAPGEQNFELLRKLVLPNGKVARCAHPGLPTRECLFSDPTIEPVLLKIFNHNSYGGVVGAFHALYDEQGEQGARIAGQVRPSDVEGIEGDEFAVYGHNSGRLWRAGRDEAVPFHLPPLGYEVFTIAPVVDGFAALGLLNLFNSGGAILSALRLSDGVIDVRLAGGGRFGFYSQQAPASAHVDAAAAEVHWDMHTCLGVVRVPESDQEPQVSLRFVAARADGGGGAP